MYRSKTSAAITTTVHREMSPRTATTIPSRTAIQSARRKRRSRNQRLAREECASITGCSRNTTSNVPRRYREPCSPLPCDPTFRPGRGVAMVKQAVHRRARPGHVRAEGAEGAELLGKRRRGDVVRRQRGKVAWTADRMQRVDERRAAFLEAVRAVALVESPVDVRRRALRRAARKDEQDPVVLGKLDRLELRAGTRAELRAVAKEEGHVGTEPRSELVESACGHRLAEELVAQAQRRGGVGAAAAETRGDRYALRDPGGELDVAVRGQFSQGACHERVAGEAGDLRALGNTHLDAIRERDALIHGRDLVHAVRTPRADDEREVEFRRRDASLHGSARASVTNSGGGSSSARVAGGRPTVSRARTASARAASPLSSTEFASVLRRCANDASTTRLTRA